MRSVSALIILLIVLSAQPISYSQCGPVKQLDFSFTKGLEYRFEGSRIVYDDFNFPLKKLPLAFHYKVLDAGSGVSNFEMNAVLDNDTVLRRQRFSLSLDKKGMVMRKNTENGKAEKTQVLSLPIEKGKRWTTDLNGVKRRVTAFTLDTAFSLPMGNVMAFGILYEYKTGSDDRFDYFEDQLEWFNVSLGNIARRIKKYKVERSSGRVFMQMSEEAVLKLSNAPAEVIAKANDGCP